MKLMNIKQKISLTILFLFINGCSLAPGMHMETQTSWLDQSRYVYI